MSETIQPGDRVRWQHRPPRHRYAGKFLTGTVRSIRNDGIDHYAIVATDPDGRVTMPSFAKLVKVEVQP